MTQIKMFKGIENDLEGLEHQVNQWLSTSRAKVLQVVGNIAPQSETVSGRAGGLASTGGSSDLFLVIVYEVA